MHVTSDITAARPSDAAIFQTLLRVAALLGERYAYFHAGSYHFALDDEWSIAVSPESAGRFRVEGCRFAVPLDTLWALADDVERLAGLVVGMKDEIREWAHGEVTHG